MGLGVEPSLRPEPESEPEDGVEVGVAVGGGGAVGAGGASLRWPEPAPEWPSPPLGVSVPAATDALALSIADWHKASGLAAPATRAVTAVSSWSTRETKVDRPPSSR